MVLFLMILLLVFIAVFMLVYSLAVVGVEARYSVKARLGSLGSNHSTQYTDPELSKPFKTRVLIPLKKSIIKTLSSVTPKETTQRFQTKITAAGSPYGFGAGEWSSIRTLFLIILPVISTIIFIITGQPLNKLALLCAVLIIIALIGPDMILKSCTDKRQKEMIRSMPDILDLLTVSVEAGLGFDAALAKVSEKSQGILADEFTRLLQEIKIGKPRRDALRQMSSRINLDEISAFTAAIIQAEQLGVSIGNVLRIQSEQLRQKRKQRAQEKAMKAPVKMLIPMVFFIFPTIFTVVLGPVVIRVFETFKG